MRSPLESALDALPHGPEFRFVDRLLEWVPGHSGVGAYRIPETAPYLAGYFPNRPLMPGVLLVECGAQVAGVVAQHDPQQARIPNLKLASIRAAKFLAPARPGDLLHIHAVVRVRMGSLVQASIRICVGELAVMEAELVLGGEEIGSTP
ncbi:MAG: beta-hydroxyacyl-ACP dehydratase [Verrucomicrobia bacterium]|nr:beta-hydroxyacyl-ACP dehydratase [Verrucomicrobiota bacterium]